MIEEDQMKGYREEVNKYSEAKGERPVGAEVEQPFYNNFENSKKKALAMIGRTDELNISQEEKESLVEEVSGLTDSDITLRLKELKSEIRQVRFQTNEMINIFNKLQVGLRDNFVKLNNKIDALSCIKRDD